MSKPQPLKPKPRTLTQVAQVAADEMIEHKDKLCAVSHAYV
jgi:hypothetical protein